MKGWPGLVAGTAALALYWRTLAPGLTWAHGGADGADLLTAALVRGVPHPSGYPTYQLALRAAITLLGGDPARAGAWLSAICTALAAALLADVARRILLALPDGSPETRVDPLKSSQAVWSGAAATLAALTWAAAPAVWGQATITEVYALNSLFCAGLWWLMARWAETAAPGYLWGSGMLLGLGLGNHLSLALILPGLAAWVLVKRRTGARFGRDLALAALAALLGLLVYATLPIAAAGRPPVNWGDPVTMDRLLWTVTGRLYAGLPFGLPLAEAPARLLGWVSEAMAQFGGPWGLLLALLGLWRLDRKDHAWWLTTLLASLAFTIYGIGYNTTDSNVYLLPAWAAVALWLAVAVDWILRRLRGTGAKAAAALALLVVLPGASLMRNWATHDLSRDRTAEEFVAAALAEAEPDALILTGGDRSTFALWYGVYGLRQREDVAILNVNLYGLDWYDATFAETHPGVLPPTERPLEEVIPSLAAQRPVYRADDLAPALPFPGTSEERTGVLVRLRAGR